MSDCCAAPGLISFELALTQLLNKIPPPIKTQLIAIEDSLDRVLASDIISPVFVPPNDNSAMDGFAFSFADINTDSLADKLSVKPKFELVGQSFAGQPFAGKCKPGQCIRIMTGAKVPTCCDTVVMQENTTLDDQIMVLDIAPKQLANNVRKRGEDISKGDLVLNQGAKVNAVDIGLLASLGIAEIEVYAPITVAILSTGDELKTPGQTLSDGDIFESNRFALKAMLRKMLVNIVDLGVIADDKQLIREAFIKADQLADVVISSGGVSVGDADYTKEVLAELGQIDFWKIAMKPGKPFAFGTLPDSVFFGLPGNPVSALVTFYQLASVGIEKMQGLAYQAKQTFRAKTTTFLKKSLGRQDFQRAVLSFDEQGLPQVTSTGTQGSGVLSSIGKANCFIILDAEQGIVEEGELVTIEPFNYLFN